MIRFMTLVRYRHGVSRCPLLGFAASKCVLGWRHSWLPRLARMLFSKTGKWESTFSTETRLELEDHWRDQIRDYDRKHQFQDEKGEKYYVLSMFPYPSGALHMGHVRVYTISDAMARFWRLKGARVLHPMGWDAFGLPAENAAIDRGERPDNWTHKNIENMKQQLEDLGCSFDWTREYATCDPAYYRWTQHLFLKMFEKGLVYQKEAPVNWDPVDQTVLANEQIDDEGRSWRSGAIAEQRLLKQWYIKATAYSKSLLDGLDSVNRDLWKDVIDLQREWIGKCDGVRLEFNLAQNSSVDQSDSTPPGGKLSVFTRTPEGAYGISHILLAREHPLNRPERHLAAQPHTGTEVRLSVEAVHPFTGQAIPLYVDHEHDFGKFLDAHLGIPSFSESDKQFADRHRLLYSLVLDHDQAGGQTLLSNSDQLSGLSRTDAFTAVSKHAMALDSGGHMTSERSRDWLISRQRYWGTPIPIIHCPKYGAVPVPYEDLPVKLPVLDNFTGKGGSPLGEAKDWLSVKCPGCDCGSFGQRETDTMDTFVDSSWYFLRYLDPTNETELVSRDAAHALMPVDLYIGGKEHAIMHLYYARFVSHFLYDLGLVPTREPFVNLLTQGMVMGRSYRLPNSGRYVSPAEVDTSGDVAVDKATGSELIVDWEKMSKSKYNGVDPQAVLTEFGTDSTRLCILANVAPKTDRNWDDKDFVGILRWQSRMWNVVGLFRQHRCHDTGAHGKPDDLDVWEEKLFEARNYTIKEVTWNLSQWFLLNVAISRLQAFTNTLLKVPVHVIPTSREFERCLATLVIMVAPLAPMYASELWAGLRNVEYHLTDSHAWTGDVLGQSWPQNDADYRMNMKVKIKEKDCYEVPLPMTFGYEGDLTREMALDLAKSHPKYETLQGIDPDHFSLAVNPQYRAILGFLPLKKKTKTKEKLTQKTQVLNSS